MPHPHLTRSLFWLTLSEIIFNLSGYVIHAGVGRILGPEGYGRYTLVITLTTVIIILIGNGIPTAMAKYISELTVEKAPLILLIKKYAIRLQFLTMGVITVIFFLLSPFIAKILHDDTLTPLFRLSSLIIPSFAAASFYFYYFTGLHKFGVQSALKIVRSIARVVLIVGLAYFFSVEGTIAGYVIAPLVVFAIAFAIDASVLRKDLHTHHPVQERFDWKKLVGFAWPITLFMLFYEFLISIDLYLVKALLHDDYLTGIYNAAITVARIPYYLFYALTIVLFPTISRATANNDHARTSSVVCDALRAQLLLLTPAVALIILFAQPLIVFFYGARYADAAPSLAILAAGTAFLTVFYILSFVFNGAGRIKIPMLLSGMGLVVNILLSVVLIPRDGIAGAALATTIASFLVMVVILFFTRKHFPFSLGAKSIARVLLATALMTIVLLFLPLRESGLWFILWSSCGGAFYIILLAFFGEITRDDYARISSVLPRRS